MIHVERMEERHIPAVAAIERLCFPDPWSEQALQLLLTDAGVCYVALENGAVLGYAGMYRSVDDGQITTVATHPAHRGRGIARAVMEAIEGDALAHGAVQLSLEVRVSNEAALALYRGLGFAVAGNRRNFYNNPTEDAFVMLKQIKE